MMATPEQLFRELLASNPGQPFVTYYDEASGERSELSVKSLANWVAKTHHLLGTELGLGAGDRALVALPAHWISVAPMLGCLTAGLEIVDDAQAADVAFVTPDTAPRAAGIPDVYAIAPSSAAAGFAASGDAPEGTNDYVLAVRPQADAWPSVQFGAGPADPGVDGRTRAQAVEWARQRAVELGIGAQARLLSASDTLLEPVLLALAVGGSLVIVRNADPVTLERRADQERVTNRL